MIAGETETLIGLANEDTFYAHHEFLGFGKKKRTPAQQAARKEKRKNFWSGVGNTIKDSGGVEGVATSIGNVVNLFRKKPAQAAPSDFQFGLGVTPPTEEKKAPISLYLIGGAVVVGLVVWGVSRSKGGSRKANSHPVNNAKPNT